MKKLIENFIIIMVLTIAILFSYALIEKKISGRSSSEFINFLFSTQEKASSNKSSVTSNKGNSKKGNNWIVQPVLLSHSINWSNPITSVQWPTTTKVGKETIMKIS